MGIEDFGLERFGFPGRTIEEVLPYCTVLYDEEVFALYARATVPDEVVRTQSLPPELQYRAFSFEPDNIVSANLSNLVLYVMPGKTFDSTLRSPRDPDFSPGLLKDEGYDSYIFESKLFGFPQKMTTVMNKELIVAIARYVPPLYLRQVDELLR